MYTKRSVRLPRSFRSQENSLFKPQGAKFSCKKWKKWSLLARWDSIAIKSKKRSQNRRKTQCRAETLRYVFWMPSFACRWGCPKNCSEGRGISSFVGKFLTGTKNQKIAETKGSWGCSIAEKLRICLNVPFAYIVFIINHHHNLSNSLSLPFTPLSI